MQGRPLGRSSVVYDFAKGERKASAKADLNLAGSVGARNGGHPAATLQATLKGVDRGDLCAISTDQCQPSRSGRIMTATAARLAPEAKVIAEAQAKREGMRLGDWLSQMVLDREVEEPLADQSTPLAPDDRSTVADSEYERVMARGSSFLEMKVRVEHAAVLLSCAFEEANVRDFDLPRFRSSAAPAEARWRVHLIRSTAHRCREVRNALVHHWTPTEEADRLAIRAFELLAELTPAPAALTKLCRRDRPRAFLRLADQMRHVEGLLDEMAEVVIDADGADADGGRSAASSAAGFDAVSQAVLEEAGGGLSLTQAAERLKVSRQALHKRLVRGTVLGVQSLGEWVVPAAQLSETDGVWRVVPDLGPIIATFREARAGVWSALQFLVHKDPRLGKTPMDALASGEAEAVAAAARAYLDLDQG